jgi:phenylacetic acid degradation protein PaaN
MRGPMVLASPRTNGRLSETNGGPPMAPVLRSYVTGGWHRPTEEGRPLHDAVTGAEVARISSAGIDFAAALEHGRRVGGPALRELTFHQRAALLKALGQHLREHRDRLYTVSAQTGATLGDSKFDVDGGIGVLLAYASKGRRELPNDTFYVEGAVEPLGRGGTFVGQHLCTSLRGVAVQINAFNFPVWGPHEKLAPAFLAGVPSLVKPASPTAFLTAELVELIVESGLLPEGSLQFVAGSTGDLLDHLTEQDLVSFTGSASTAAKLRTHPTVVQRAVRFTAEADSLNLSVLGPDAVPGTPEFDLYVKGVVAEMTVKAGQKCTAIRRVIVPEAHRGAVIEAVSDRLARTTIGNPREEATQQVRQQAVSATIQDHIVECRRRVDQFLAIIGLCHGNLESLQSNLHFLDVLRCHLPCEEAYRVAFQHFPNGIDLLGILPGNPRHRWALVRFNDDKLFGFKLTQYLANGRSADAQPYAHVTFHQALAWHQCPTKNLVPYRAEHKFPDRRAALASVRQRSGRRLRVALTDLGCHPEMPPQP